MNTPSRFSLRIRRGLGALLLALLIAREGMAAERELDRDTAPGSTGEIETPIDRTFPEPTERRPLFPAIRKSMKDLPAFFRDTRLEARLRTYYFRRDRTSDTLSEAWAGGGSLYYKSGWLGDVFSIEVEGFTSQRLVAEDSKAGTSLLEPVQDGYSALGIANGTLRHSGLRLTGYRQYLDLPYFNRSDSRMTPNTFEAITLAKSEGSVRFSVGYSWKIKNQVSKDFESLTRSIGLSKDRGLIHGGAVWIPNDRFRTGVIVGVVRDLVTGVYSEVGYSQELKSGVEGRIDGQFTYQADQGDDLFAEGLDDTWSLGLRTSASYADTVVRLGGTVTGGGGAIFSAFGTSPSYVDLMTRTFTAENEKALLLSVSRDFSSFGAEGFSAIINFVAGFDGQRSGQIRDSQELDLTLDYRPRRGRLENFWFRLRGAWLHEDSAEQDGIEVRVIVRYDFAVI